MVIRFHFECTDCQERMVPVSPDGKPTLEEDAWVAKHFDHNMNIIIPTPLAQGSRRPS